MTKAFGIGTVYVAFTALASTSPTLIAQDKKGPLAELPSKPGAHVEQIKALGDNEWLNLGAPAADHGPKAEELGHPSHRVFVQSQVDVKRVEHVVRHRLAEFVKQNESQNQKRRIASEKFFERAEHGFQRRAAFRVHDQRQLYDEARC